ncbi:hypothetical protein BHE74_00016020, partial [Ensete ventricosum]
HALHFVPKHNWSGCALARTANHRRAAACFPEVLHLDSLGLHCHDHPLHRRRLILRHLLVGEHSFGASRAPRGQIRGGAARRGGQRRRQRGSGRCRGRCGRTRQATGQSCGVEEEDGEEGERVGGEDLVVVEAEVGAEPDDEAASSGRRRELEILEGVESLKEGLEGAGD